jgi:hypothetical protein
LHAVPSHFLTKDFIEFFILIQRHFDNKINYYCSFSRSDRSINSIQFNSIQFNSIQFNPFQSISFQFISIQFNSIQFNSIQFRRPLLLANMESKQRAANQYGQQTKSEIESYTYDCIQWYTYSSKCFLKDPWLSRWMYDNGLNICGYSLLFVLMITLVILFLDDTAQVSQVESVIHSSRIIYIASSRRDKNAANELDWIELECWLNSCPLYVQEIS